MRTLTRITAALAAAAAVCLAPAPAQADPAGSNGNPVTPRSCDVAGAGAATTEFVFDQFSHDYNTSKGGSQTASCTTNRASYLYSWDATNPKTGAIHETITTKNVPGCAIPRPDGSSEGITLLGTQAVCADYARSTRPWAGTDPVYGPAGLAWAYLAADGVTWASQAVTSAPASLTVAQLHGIYSCTTTNWSQVGGKAGAIQPFLPPAGSSTWSFFLAAIGLASPGACVTALPDEDDGADLPLVANKNAITPYSISAYIAQRYHSAKCIGCAPLPATCTPGAHQNLFGCNVHGTTVLREVDGISPTRGTGRSTEINPAFPPAFLRYLFDVVAYSTASGQVNQIPPNLVPFFGPAGWICGTATAGTDLHNYGYLVLPPAAGNTQGQCGATSGNGGPALPPPP